jgi:hypothetical protein
MFLFTYNLFRTDMTQAVIEIMFGEKNRKNATNKKINISVHVPGIFIIFIITNKCTIIS